jgi:hypothetical protein
MKNWKFRSTKGIIMRHWNVRSVQHLTTHCRIKFPGHCIVISYCATSFAKLVSFFIKELPCSGYYIKRVSILLTLIPYNVGVSGKWIKVSLGSSEAETGHPMCKEINPQSPVTVGSLIRASFVRINVSILFNSRLGIIDHRFRKTILDGTR